MNKGNDNSSKSRKNPSKPPFNQFLKESGIKTLVFLGKCMQYWGIKPALIFLFGAFSLWVLALFYPLPGYNVFSEQNKIEQNKIEQNYIILHGNVKIQKIGRRAETFKNEFEIVLGTIKGPFNYKEFPDGSFKVIVPLLQEYSIVVMCKDENNYRYFGNQVLAKINGTYRLLDTLVLHD